jgi:hypothetical protein
MHTAIFAKRSSWALVFSLVSALSSIGCDELDGLTPTVATPTLIEIDVQNGSVTSLPGPDALNKEKEYSFVNMMGASDTNLAFCNLTGQGIFCDRWNKDTRKWTPGTTNTDGLGKVSSISVGGLLCALGNGDVGSCYDLDADTWTVHDEFMSLAGHFFVGIWAGRPIVNKSGELFAVDLAAKTIESLGSLSEPNCIGYSLVGEIGGELYAITCLNVYRYSLNDKNWLPVATGGFRVLPQVPLIVGDKLCGVDVFDRFVGCFEPATNKITVSKPVPAPAGWVAYGTGYAQSSVTVGGRIYASFTYSNLEPTLDDLRKFQGSLQEYNPETDTWTEKLSIPDGSVPEMTTFGDRVYAVGNLNAPISTR